LWICEIEKSTEDGKYNMENHPRDRKEENAK
jgi:hypothetical protein